MNEFIQDECLLWLEETIKDHPIVSIYNPTSIGATLVGFVEGDLSLHTPEFLSTLSPRELSVLESEFPALKQYLETRDGHLDFKTLIHAVPDNHTRPGIAGAFKVTSPHLPGDGKKFMGLGSSGFPHKILLQEVIMRSINKDGAFQGKDHVHPTTHTMGYIAAALTFASEIQQHGKDAKLPELAGSFAVAGRLQEDVDQAQLSAVEVAWTLKRAGIGLNEFIELDPEDYQTSEDFLKRAKSEGEAMGHFAEEFISALAMDVETLSYQVSKIRAMRNTRACSRWPLESVRKLL